MAETFVGIDLSQPEGEQLSPEMRAEIARLAPNQVGAGSITEEKLGTAAVSTTKLEDGAVTSAKIAGNSIDAAHIANGAVGTGELAPAAVTPDKAGTGIVLGYDANGDPIALKIVPITNTSYAGITPDPDTIYAVYTL